jgi:phytanoyl-CoA hydroxylase
MIPHLKDTFDAQGYVVVEDVLDPTTDIQPLYDDYAALLDKLAHRFFAEGKLPSAFSDLSFEERISAVLSHSTENLYKYFDIAIANEAVTEDSPIHLSRVIFNLLRTPRLLDAVETLIGGEILANPIQHVRIKPPGRMTETQEMQSSLVKRTGWHQDQGVMREEADASDIITVWIAITDATVENGCLQVIPYSHRQGITTHCPTGLAMNIPDALLGGQPTPIELRAGSALVMHRLTKHASLPNVSDGIRWSFDLRYQPIGTPTGRDEYPSLIVRSRANPSQVQDDYDAWGPRMARGTVGVGNWHRSPQDAPLGRW